MFTTIEAHHLTRVPDLLDQMFRLRKKVFADQLGWDVDVRGDHERDAYDDFRPTYLVWCDPSLRKLYGALRLMPTTGPTLLYDRFRSTFPGSVNLVSPAIWEGTRMCVDTDALAIDHPELEPSRAFGMLLLALCECALEHGIGTMISNYEPQMKRVYRRAGLQVDELGRADGYGRYPVCCGAFEVNHSVHAAMQESLSVDLPVYRKMMPNQTYMPLVEGARATTREVAVYA